MNAVDIFLGQKIRQRRVELGLSQAEIADAIGVGFQQIQKYETGLNRVSASRLWAIAEALHTPIERFFEGTTAKARGTDPMAETDLRALRLMRDFNKLPESQKCAILAIVKSMAGEVRGCAGDAAARRM